MGTQSPGPANEVPVELGQICWQRGFETACYQAADQNRPLLVLFQEVPGCRTCKNYGQKVLSHPLIVEAAETLFVPVAIYNNIEGADHKTLCSFNEPTWNNPVIRIVDVNRNELAPRVADDYSVAGLAGAMVRALERRNQPMPRYLVLLAEEEQARATGTEKAVFAMHCFWVGEARLGSLPGVVATTPGFLDEEEVVEVEFDPQRLPFKTLCQQALELECAQRVYARTDAQVSVARGLGVAVTRTEEPLRQDADPKHHLAETLYRHIPMTALQACRVNAAVADPHVIPDGFLSPRQLELLAKVRRNPDAGWPSVFGVPDLQAAWKTVMDVTPARQRIGQP